MKVYEVEGIKDILESNNIVWQELESKPELFQYNHYMRFCYDIERDDIQDIISKIYDDQLFKVSKFYALKLFAQQYPLRQYEEPYEYTSKINRHYICIKVDKDSRFCTEDNIYIPEVGQEFIVDPDSMYSIYNNGTEEAIYLVVDILKN